jgi:hypothetical protein
VSTQPYRTPVVFGARELLCASLIHGCKGGKCVESGTYYRMVWYGMVPLLPPVSVFCH